MAHKRKEPVEHGASAVLDVGDDTAQAAAQAAKAEVERVHDAQVTALMREICRAYERSTARVCEEWRRKNGPSADGVIEKARQRAHRSIGAWCVPAELRDAAAGAESDAAEWRRLADEIDSRDAKLVAGDFVPQSKAHGVP